MGEYLRYSTSLPDSLNELAIIVAGRHWNSQLEFHIHAQAAKAAGLDSNMIESIRLAQAPIFRDPAELEVYDYARLLLATGDLPDEVHNAIVKRWGEKGAVELTGVIGYYTMVSFTLNAHQIPMVDDAPHPLPVLVGNTPTILPAGLLASN
jgi:4-carboxymuconolactone decarboxylase